MSTHADRIAKLTIEVGADGGVRPWLRSSEAANPIDADRKELEAFVKKEASDRLRQRLKEVADEAKRYGL